MSPASKTQSSTTQASTASVALNAGSLATAFAATMIAMFSFAHARPLWGGYNLAIALVALVVVVMVRSRGHDT